MPKRRGVELTDSARRKAEKAGLLKKTGSGAANRAGKKIIRNQDAAERARRMADKAMGITRR